MSSKSLIVIAALALVAGQALAEYPTTNCDGSAPVDGQATTGAYSQSSAGALAATIMEGTTGFTVGSASLIGFPEQAGVIDFCQGDVYNVLSGAGTKQTDVAVFTTGNGSLAAYAPANGYSPFGLSDDNYAGNDRYSVFYRTAADTGATGSDTEYGAVCKSTVSGTETKDFETSGIKMQLTATAAGTLVFNYMFASEEYPEYVSREYKDQMRILVKKNGGEYVNVATVNGQPVGIDTVNSGDNSDLYIANDPSLMGGGFTPFSVQYDGSTQLLATAPVTVVPGDVLDVVVLVNDCNDVNLDSAILLQGQTFNTAPVCYPAGQGVVVNPEPSSPGDEVTVTYSVADTDVESAVCVFASGASVPCTNFEEIVGAPTTAFSCSATYTTVAGDYEDGGAVVCTATDSAGQQVDCEGAISLVPNNPPVCYPAGQGVAVNPEPSSPGDEVTVTYSVADTDVESAVCVFASGASVPCTDFQAIVGAPTTAFSCSATYTTVAGDYADGGAVVCTATDSAGQQVDCEGAISLVPPPPSPAVPPPPPSPSIPAPKPPSPAVAPPFPPPSPDGVCTPPTIPEPIIPDGADPTNAACWIYGDDGTTVIDSSTKTCSGCQWQCLTNMHCTGIALYSEDNIISRADLATFNCGDGGWNNGANLCVLVGPEGSTFLYPDTQEQGVCECQNQCQYWGECSGVFYSYTYYAKANLGDMCC